MGDIQALMLNALGQTGLERFAPLRRRIMYATDLTGLWHLRGDLMAALAELQSEAQARDTVQNITEHFQGLLDGNLNSRPSPLA